MSKTVLVFDFGASSARAMLCRLATGGGLELEEIHRFPNIPVTEGGRLCWDIDELFGQMKAAIRLAASNTEVDAISIDTWGVDFGLIDKGGRLIGKPIHYRDGCSEGMPEEVEKIIPAGELFKQSGVLPQSINTLYRLYYLVNHEPSVISEAERLLMMPDLFAYLLTGECRSEYTEATTSQLIDCAAHEWNFPLIDRLGIPKRLFCPIIQPGEVYGTLKGELAAELGARPVPVYACASHDTASAVAAVPTEEKGFTFLSCGTWTLLGTESERPAVNERAFKMELTNEGGTNGTTTLLKNIMGLWLIQETKRWYNSEQCAGFSFADLEDAARGAKPLVSLINPNFRDFAAPDDMPPKIREYCRKTGQPVPETAGEIMRCIYQSLACEFALTLGELSELTGNACGRLHMIGGGTKDSFLCQLTADACGITVTAGPTEATALGNGISTLTALGELPSISAARKMISESALTREFTPSEHERWLPVLERYRKLTR